MAIIDLLRRLVRCTSGTAALEAAIVLPVAISLMVGGVEFGRLFSAYGTAEKSTRDAARYLARVPKAHVCDWGLTNAQNLAVYGNIAGTGPALILGWTTGTVTLNGIDCANPSIIDLRAAVPYTEGIMWAVIGLANAWTIGVKHQERWIGE